MRAIKINIAGASFLLPESHQFYEFPTHILRHKAEIKQHIEASKKFSSNPLIDHPTKLPDLSEFKRITGIIGFPFDARDPDLYALDKGIEISLEVDL